MPTKQTRRSLSVSGALYDRLKEHCEENSTSMSATAEEVLREHFGMEPRDPKLARPSSMFKKDPKVEVEVEDPKVTPIEPHRRRKLIERAMERTANVYTF